MITGSKYHAHVYVIILVNSHEFQPRPDTIFPRPTFRPSVLLEKNRPGNDARATIIFMIWIKILPRHVIDQFSTKAPTNKGYVNNDVKTDWSGRNVGVGTRLLLAILTKKTHICLQVWMTIICRGMGAPGAGALRYTLWIACALWKFDNKCCYDGWKSSYLNVVKKLTLYIALAKHQEEKELGVKCCNKPTFG